MVAFTQHDLQFVLNGIIVSEQHASATNTVTGNVWEVADLATSRLALMNLLPNSLEPIGMRTISGELNNLVVGQGGFGATGEFPRLLDPNYRNDATTGNPGDATNTTFGPPNTNYSQSTGSPSGGNVVDSDPRIISNLIVDQSVNNPVAVFAAGANSGAETFFGDDPTTIGIDESLDDTFGDGVELIDPNPNVIGDEFFFIPNVAPDEGLSAPFNAWMTFFGQFFDHGLDLVAKGGSGTVFIPLQPDDPLIAGADHQFGTTDDLPASMRFMVLTRATVDPGPDGVLGTPDDVADAQNHTSPFVDQNQTYSSHPSHQLFLRAYELDASGKPQATGMLIEGSGGGMATWANVKAQAQSMLGIELTDMDAISIPLFAVDQYGEFLRGPGGLPQLVMADGTLLEGNLADPIMVNGLGEAIGSVSGTNFGAAAPRTGFSFLLDIAHDANPINSQTGLFLTRYEDGDANDGINGGPGTYDGDLLDAHFIAGDGRANENIGLTAVHHVFHQEHNRLVDHIKETLLSAANNSDLATVGDPTGAQAALDLLNGYLRVPLAALAAPGTLITDASLVWDGDRLFQAAKFGTEMQYQHLVFEEFARKVQPLVDLFASYESSIDAAIVAEFAHTVYRFGHSMLTETVDLMAPDGTLTEVGLIEAFLNPLGFNQLIDSDGNVTNADIALQDSSVTAGALVRGLTRQTGNEIDEFVTEALRNNLLGLPLDLPAINLARGRDTGIPTLNDARRDFFEGTGDAKLRPYESWVDFALHLKHGGASIVNFVASYGQHDLVTQETTLEGKRAAALAITTGVNQDILDANGAVLRTIAAPTDRLDFLNSTGAWATQESGLNLVDFWIGGLAEAIEPFGGMLGSTFNFVFEHQLENLQDGDRFYYLGRTAGLNFINQLEQNSFANMIIRNTDIGDIPGGDHLPGDIFSTPAWILEVDQTRQLTGLGLDGRDDPTGDGASGGQLNPFLDLGTNSLVIRDNPATPGVDTNYLHYTGGDHVVLGGTSQRDVIIGSIGDDTLWGEDGDDDLEGGDGADIVLGGEGDDVITDIGGPNNLQGQGGNDAISASGGESLILAGDGKDFVLQGPDFAETFGGQGDDFINAGTESNIVFGNEGNDWLEGGGGNNLLVGDNADKFLSSTAGGHDVFISGLGDDDYDSEGGDDIMEGADGVQRFEGLNGFDWATYMNVDQGVSADMLLRAFIETPIPPSNVSIQDRFDSVEGLSGGRGSDILRGSDQTSVEITTLRNGNDSVLRNFDLIRGMREGDFGGAFDANAIFTTATGTFTSANLNEWGEGDIILGGAGSDLIEGRAGNDIIDGDLKMNVALGWTARDANGAVIATGRAAKMQGELIVETGALPAGVTFLHDAVFARIINPGDIEIIREIINESAASDFDTAEFSGLRADYTIETDINGVIGDGDGDGYIRISHDSAPGLNDGLGANGVDHIRNIERLQFADQTINLAGGNTPATGAPTITDEFGAAVGTPTVGQILRANPAGIMDADGVPANAIFAFTWQVEQVPGSGIFIDLITINVGDEDGPLIGVQIVVPPDAAGLALRVKAAFQDGAGVIETVFSAATDIVGGVAATVATEGADLLIGTAGDDLIQGLGGDDDILGLGGNDTLIGGSQTAMNNAGNDILDGGPGADTADFFGDPRDITQFEFVLDPAGNLEVVDVQAAGGVGEEDLLLSVETIRFFVPGVAAPIVFNTQDIIDNLIANPGGDPLAGVIPNPTQGDDLIIGNNSANLISGLGGNDQIFGLGGNDTLNGGADNDTVDGGAGDDLLDGGAGSDRAIFAGPLANYGFAQDANGDLVVTDNVGTDGSDTLRNIEQVTFDGQTYQLLDGPFFGTGGAEIILTNTAIPATYYGGNGDDLLVGDASANALRADAGNDTILAGDGADILVGGDGSDSMDGGTGNDSLHGDGGGGGLLDGNDSMAGGAGDDWLAGYGGNDNLFGDSGADIVIGGAGDDVLEGGTGDDIVSGGAGDDTIVWRANDAGATDGRDVVIGGSQVTATGDTFEMIGRSGLTEVFDVYSNTDGLNNGWFNSSAHNAGFAINTAAIIVTYTVNGTTSVIAELNDIEEIKINTAFPSVINPNVNPDPMGDIVNIHGNFTNTGLNVNTFTIQGTAGDDQVDITGLTSEHRIVFHSNGGNDSVSGRRAQDEIHAPAGSMIIDNGDGTVAILELGGSAAPEGFGFTGDDITELLNLVRGIPSDNADSPDATGVRDLEGTGNNRSNPEYGSADQPFIRLTPARYGELLQTTEEGELVPLNRAINPIFEGLDPRTISNILGAQEDGLPANAEGANIFFMAFGQYFDHGLDFLPKGGNGTISIGGGDDDPADLSRGSVDSFDENGIPQHLNKTSPFVDQNQAYGSTELVGQFLREGNGGGGLGAHLLSGESDPSNPSFNLLPTLSELILEHWTNNTVFTGVPGGLGPNSQMSFQDYFTALDYEVTTPSGIEFRNGTLVDANGNINEDMIPFINGNFMESGFTLVGDANPLINLLDHFVAGDLRANENYTLTSIHTIWGRNHNHHVDRLMEAGFQGSAQELFEAAKIVNEAEYQRVVFTEFADKLLGGLRGSGEHAFDDYNPGVDARVSHEFAAAVYRVGHSLISQTITVLDGDGNPMQVPLTSAFLNPTNDNDAINDSFRPLLPANYVGPDGFEQIGVDRIIGGIVTQPAEEVDFNLVDAVRNDLVNIRADLFAFNVARGWDVGLGSLNQVRADLMRSDSPYIREAIERSGADLSPYASWDDFRERNGLSAAVLAQFMAAYPDLTLQPGDIAEFELINPDITVTENADGTGTVRGIDRVDLWVGGLAEEHIRGGMVGSTFWVVLHEQFDRLQEGDRFYYLNRVDGFDFYDHIEDQTFADIIARNTGLEGLPSDIFGADLGDTGNTGEGDGAGDTDNTDDSGNTDGTGDTASDGTGTPGDAAGTGTLSDPIPGEPVPASIIGDENANTLLGGIGDSVISGMAGDDVVVATQGNNVLAGGDGADNIISGDGNDVVLGGGGADFIETGGGNDVVLGGGGRDVVDLGAGDDTVYAELNDGDDVLRGGEGTDTYDLSAITADVTVNLSIGRATSTQSGIDTLVGFEDVVAGAGNDTIIANTAVNVLTGGIGADSFEFHSIAAANGDRITDFEPGDRINLSAIDANANLDGHQAFTFLESTTFTAAGQVIIHDNGNDAILEGDVDGDQVADFTITISGRPDLNNSDLT